METHERPWDSPSVPAPVSLGLSTSAVAPPGRDAYSHPSSSRLKLGMVGGFVVEWQRPGGLAWVDDDHDAD